MNNRALLFILLSSAIMMTAMVLQTAFMPKPPAENGAVAEQVDNGDAEAEGQNLKLADGETAADAIGESSDNGSVSDDASNEASGQTSNETSNNKQAAAEQAESESATDQDSESEPSVDDAEQEPTPKNNQNPLDKFVTIGSLDEAGGSRYLITLNEVAGTVRRVELNYRLKNKNNRYKYRDLEYKGGYLGCLDCLDEENGCVVRSVGNGTPAGIAGVKVGDVLVSLDAEPIVSAEEFEARLGEAKPGDTVQLKVRRGESETTVSVLLTDKPIELLKPENTRIDPGFDYPESFVFSLLRPLPQFNVAWPDLDQGMRSEKWQLEPSDNPNQIVFSYQLSESTLKSHGLVGPIKAYKRYTLPDVGAEDFYNPDSQTFHFNLEIEIVNESDQLQKVAYELDGPTGCPPETWWYAMKIHGRSTAIGYVAGARDIAGSSGGNSYEFFGGPEIVKAKTKTRPDPKFICRPGEKDPKWRELNFVGVDALYYNTSLIPEMGENEVFSCNSCTADTNGGLIPEKNIREQKLVDCTFRMAKSVDLPPNGVYKQTFKIFSGPKEAETLEQYGLGDNRTFGWFAWCSKPLMWLLHFFYNITFQWSYGLAIIMLTVLVRCLMIPISRKAALNAQMMQHLQPQMKEIADKYKDDMEKRAAAQRELFKKYKYNPFGGCFMMFFQLPIFIGLYRGLSVDINLRDQPLIPGLDWCANLSGPDQFWYWKDWMPGFLADETGWLGPFLNVLPLLTMVLFIVQQKLFMPPATDDQQKMMQKVMKFMMIFMGVMFFKVASGLCLYFITSSIWGIVERKMLPKPVLDTDKLDGGSGVLAGGGKGGGNFGGGSGKKKWADTAAEEKRKAEMAANKKRNAERKKRLRDRGH